MLLNVDANAKTVKGQKAGYLTGVLYLAPAEESGVMNTCPMAGNCKGPCLNRSGRAEFEQHGFNLAVAFDTRKGEDLPATWRGYRVVDGDTNDLRFLDGHQSLIIGLRAKGRRAKNDASGFVQLAALTNQVTVG